MPKIEKSRLSPAYIGFLTARVRDGVSDQEIADELVRLTRKPVTRETIAATRQLLKLESPDYALQETENTPSRHRRRAASFDAPIVEEADYIENGLTEKFSEKAGRKESVSGRWTEKNARLRKASSPGAVYEETLKPVAAIPFAPVFPSHKQFRKGHVYIMPKIGAVTCLGRNVTEAAGIKLETIAFSEVLTSKNGVIINIPVKKIADAKIREPASKEYLDNLLARMTAGQFAKEPRTRNVSQKLKHLTAVASDMDLEMMGRFILSSMVFFERGDNEEKCLRTVCALLAAEYAAATKISLGAAASKIDKAAQGLIHRENGRRKEKAASGPSGIAPAPVAAP